MGILQAVEEDMGVEPQFFAIIPQEVSELTDVEIRQIYLSFVGQHLLTNKSSQKPINSRDKQGAQTPHALD